MATIEPETLSVALHASQDTKAGQLIVSATNVTDATHRTVDLVVGTRWRSERRTHTESRRRHLP